jgi:hypothetical protein
MGAQQLSPADLAMRDLCELEPADPGAADTVCVSLADLQVVLARYIGGAGAPASAPTLERGSEGS